MLVEPLTWPLRVPLRISRSTSITFFRVRAKLMARFIDTNVFPAFGLKEVNITTFISFAFTRMKSIFVRTIRNASEILSRPFSRTTISSLFFLSRKGISPRNGIDTASSTSLRVRTVVFMTICNQMIPAGIANPNTTAANKIIIDFGATGLRLPCAASITRALLSVIACDKAFSSRLFNK